MDDDHICICATHGAASVQHRQSPDENYNGNRAATTEAASLLRGRDSFIVTSFSALFVSKFDNKNDYIQ